MKNQQNWLQLILCGLIFTSTPANAQITPDNTLNSESSRLTPNVQINGASADRIDGGAARGSNLFHSFSDFNLNDGQRVYFGNPTGIENILTRVTGTSASNIFGTLGVDGAANLFLLNPNGIVFGKNAQLDIRGSFLGTTANQIQFGNQGTFSATNPQAPPLLTINPSALLFTQLGQSGITNQSQAPVGINPAGENVTGLRVPDGKSLLLVGGDINIDGSKLLAYGGRIDLAGLAAPGTIELNVAGDTLSLSVPNDVARADISLTNAGEINVRGAEAGNIAINARNLSLAGESKVRAGIDTGLGTPQSQAGNIKINATGTTTLTDTSLIANVLQARSVGKGGDINLTTGSLEILNGSSVNTSIFGQGDGGDINLNVSDALTIAGLDKNGLSSAILSDVVSEAEGNGGNININAGTVVMVNGGIYSTVDQGAIGNGGNININTGTVSATNGSELQASTSGQGNGGNIIVNAKDRVSFDGKSEEINSRVIAAVLPGAVGNGGEIQVTTGTLSLSNGAFFSASTLGTGNAGNVFISADSVSMVNGYIYSTVDREAVGNGGNININAGTVSATNGSELQASTSGQGNGGNIIINARDRVSFDGKGEEINSRAIAGVLPGAVGNSGEIQVTTGTLSLSNGAFFSASTLGTGDAGNIIIDANDTVELDGGYAQSNVFSGGGVGKGGDIQVTTGTLSLINGGQLSTNVSGQGEAGNITVDARDAINLDGIVGFSSSGIKSGLLTDAVGKGGDIRLTTGTLSVTNGASLDTSTNGRGNAGNILINARDTVTFDGVGNDQVLPSNASSTVGSNAVGNGGEIQINASGLFLKMVVKSKRIPSGKAMRVKSPSIPAI
ncbi:MAG: filamentous hemagglutinin N-terminal domain-containing protein [Richelia sp. RM1_1_1]|nr:filamentous hemagglutinin N-terminal domain-containing protein [Richelia sp. RM1_1_1]